MRKRLPTHRSTPATAIGARIRARRDIRKLTAREAAALAGLDWSSYCRIERGDRSPRYEEMERIAHALTCRVRDLIPTERPTP